MKYGKPHILNGRGEYVPFNLNCYSSLMTAKAGEHQEEARAVKLAEKEAEREEQSMEKEQQKEADKEGGSILEELSKIAKKLRGNSSKEYYTTSYSSAKRATK